jgi:hypothetical protein
MKQQKKKDDAPPIQLQKLHVKLKRLGSHGVAEEAGEPNRAFGELAESLESTDAHIKVPDSSQQHVQVFSELGVRLKDGLNFDTRKCADGSVEHVVRDPDLSPSFYKLVTFRSRPLGIDIEKDSSGKGFIISGVFEGSRHQDLKGRSQWLIRTSRNCARLSARPQSSCRSS